MATVWLTSEIQWGIQVDVILLGFKFLMAGLLSVLINLGVAKASTVEEITQEARKLNCTGVYQSFDPDTRSDCGSTVLVF